MAVVGAALAWLLGALAALAHPGVAQVAPRDLAAWLGEGSADRRVLVLDARETEEHAVSRIPGAVRVAPDAAALPDDSRADDAALVVVACSLGWRSGALAARLVASGAVPRERVANLRGGLFAWARAGLPMEDASGAPTRAVHPWRPWLGRALGVPGRTLG